MSDDLVKRLREAVNGEHDMTPHGADCLIAADRIEEADRAIANLQCEYDKRGDRIEALEQSVVRLEREVRWWEEDSATRIEALERENRLYRIMVEDCDRQRKTQYARAEALEQRLEATKDKAEAAILDLMAERDRAEARLAKAVEALRLAVAELEDADVPNMVIALLHSTLAEMGDKG